MRRLVLHLLVAVLAFLIGVSAAVLLGNARMPRARVRSHTSNALYALPDRESPPPARRYGCPNSRRDFYGTTVTVMPMTPEQPVPPASAGEGKTMRIRVKRADGSVEVIKSAPVERRKL